MTPSRLTTTDEMSMIRGAPAPDSCLIVGGGPAGFAPLVAAAYAGKLGDILDAGVTIIERSNSVGSGEIGKYAISSDSAAEALLDAVMRTEEPQLAALRHHPIVTLISKSIGQSIPLKLASAYLSLIGETLCDIVRSSPKGRVLLQHTAISARQSSPGWWTTRVRCEVTGREEDICTSSVVIATGAHQPISRLRAETISGIMLLPTYAGKVIQSGYLLTDVGTAEIAHRLSHEKHPQVVVVGGSTSAGAVARTLLEQDSKGAFGAASITLMHRRPLRIFYNSVTEAMQDGYEDFGPDDICPVSGKVYRLAGFRLETRELMMRVMGIAGRQDEPRLRLHLLGNENVLETQRLLDEAHVIIAAIGYRPRALPVFDRNGQALTLKAASDAMQPMVDNNCRVLDQFGLPIEGLYGIGLASGFVPSGAFGGEKSFRGQSNSLWLWQHAVGEQIVDAILKGRSNQNPHVHTLHSMVVGTATEEA
jgi:hypothetical protein